MHGQLPKGSDFGSGMHQPLSEFPLRPLSQGEVSLDKRTGEKNEGRGCALTLTNPSLQIWALLRVGWLGSLGQGFSKSAPWTSGRGITWELVKNAHSQAPLQNYRIENFGDGANHRCLTSPPGHSATC